MFVSVTGRETVRAWLEEGQGWRIMCSQCLTKTNGEIGRYPCKNLRWLTLKHFWSFSLMFTEDCNSALRGCVAGLWSLVTEGAWQALSSGRGWSCQHRLTESLSPAPGSSQPIRGRHSSRCCTIPSQSGAEAARKGWRYNKNGLTQTLTPINALMRSIDREPPPAWLMMEHERDKSPVVLLLGLRPGGRGSVGSVSGGLSFPPSFSHPSVSPPLQCAAVCCTELQWGRMVAWAQHSLLPPPFLCLSPGVLCQVQICKNIHFMT